MKPQILVLQKLHDRQMDQLAAAYEVHRYDLAEDKEALLEKVGGSIRGVVTSGGPGLPLDLIPRLPKLEIAALSSVGYDTVDISACTNAGIRITNTPDVLNDDVADTAMMLLLASMRHLVEGHAHVVSGEWGRQGALPLYSTIRGKRLGIVGLGRIGKAIAARAEPFGLDISYMGRHEQKDVAYRYERDLVQLARDSDILIVITAGGGGTRGLVNREVIEALGPKGTLINVSRGTVIDEPEMIAALRDGRLGAAGLDVYLNEPNPDPAFRELPNVTLYPHHASGTQETRDAMCQLVVDNLAAHFAGKPLLTPVN
jgi:lactate dehydrogenase-like 2-hydroxyacid dehydrogenase